MTGTYGPVLNTHAVCCEDYYFPEVKFKLFIVCITRRTLFLQYVCFLFPFCLPCISCGTYCNKDKGCVVAYRAADFCVTWLVKLISSVIIIIFASLFLLARDKGIIGRGYDLRLLACLLSLFTFARIACLLQL